MKLMYIWARIKNGKTYEEYELNFSRDYKITSREENYKRIITLEKEKTLNIFSEKVDVKGVNQVFALVGKNGSGKSLIMRRIKERGMLFNFGDLDFDDQRRWFEETEKAEVIKLFKNRGEYKTSYFGHKNRGIKVFVDGEEKKVEPSSPSEWCPIYYNPYLGNYEYEEGYEVRGNISYAKRFSKNISTFQGHVGHNMFRTILNEDLRNIYLMFYRLNRTELGHLEKIITKEGEEAKSLREIKIILKFQGQVVDAGKGSLFKERVDFNEIFPDFNGIREGLRERIKLIYGRILRNISKSSDGIYNIINGEGQISYSEIKSKLTGVTSEEIKSRMDDNERKNEKFILNEVEAFKKFKELVEILVELTAIGKGVISKSVRVNSSGQDQYTIPLKRVLESEILEDFIWMQEVDYLDVDTGFSDGQWSILKLFANIYREIEDHYKDEEEILIILDEGDMGFHPEWQRKYLNMLIEFFNTVWGEEKRINLILASHSPFIASDLPTENVIFLGSKDEVEKAKEMKTFGANIHELYKDSFFMKSTMGEFALGKIRGVINDLNEYSCLKRSSGEIDEKVKKLTEKTVFLTDKEKEEKEHLEKLQGKKRDIEARKDKIKYTIDSIGERVLSRKIKEKYREVFGEEESSKDKENRISSLLERLSEEEREFLKSKLGGANA